MEPFTNASAYIISDVDGKKMLCRLHQNTYIYTNLNGVWLAQPEERISLIPVGESEWKKIGEGREVIPLIGLEINATTFAVRARNNYFRNRTNKLFINLSPDKKEKLKNLDNKNLFIEIMSWLKNFDSKPENQNFRDYVGLFIFGSVDRFIIYRFTKEERAILIENFKVFNPNPRPNLQKFILGAENCVHTKTKKIKSKKRGKKSSQNKIPA